MPSGRVHAVITLAAAGLTYAWGTARGESPVMAAAAAAGCAVGVILTPDLDIKGTRADKIIRNETGLIPAILWGLLWNPYSSLIPHRSWLSHGPIIGTAIRIIYIAVPLFIIGILPRPTAALARIIGGLVISDNLHIGADFIITGIQKHGKSNK